MGLPTTGAYARPSPVEVAHIVRMSSSVAASIIQGLDHTFIILKRSFVIGSLPAKPRRCADALWIRETHGLGPPDEQVQGTRLVRITNTDPSCCGAETSEHFSRRLFALTAVRLASALSVVV